MAPSIECNTREHEGSRESIADHLGDRHSGAARNPQVKMKNAVVATPQRGRQEVRQPLLGHEHPGARAIGIADADPAAVLNWDGLIQTPLVDDGGLRLGRHPSIHGKTRSRSTRGQQYEAINHDRDHEERRDRPNQAANDVADQFTLSLRDAGLRRLGAAIPHRCVEI